MEPASPCINLLLQLKVSLFPLRQTKLQWEGGNPPPLPGHSGVEAPPLPNRELGAGLRLRVSRAQQSRFASLLSKLACFALCEGFLPLVRSQETEFGITEKFWLQAGKSRGCRPSLIACVHVEEEGLP